MANGTGSSTTAPYGPWSAFEKWLAGFRGKPVPRRIEPNLFSGISGSGQSQLRGALRFFGLVAGDRDEVMAEPFKTLVEAVNTDQWRPTLAKLIPVSYAHVIEGVDIENGTEGQLREAFGKAGGVQASSSTNKKARRFFLAAMDAAGLSYSPFFSPDGQNGTKTDRASNGRSRGSRARRGRRQPEPTAPSPAEPMAPEGMERINFSMPERKDITVMVPFGLDPEEQDYVIDSLKRYFDLKRRKKGGSSPNE